MFEFMNKPLGICEGCDKFGFIFAVNYRYCKTCMGKQEEAKYISSCIGEVGRKSLDLNLDPSFITATCLSDSEENNFSQNVSHLEQTDVEIFDGGSSGGGGATGSWESSSDSSSDSSSSDCGSSDCSCGGD